MYLFVYVLASLYHVFLTVLCLCVSMLLYKFVLLAYCLTKSKYVCVHVVLCMYDSVYA